MFLLFGRYAGYVEMLETGDLIRLDQQMLETVIPVCPVGFSWEVFFFFFYSSVGYKKRKQ